MQGAGGVGGLIGVTTSGGTTYFATYDGNGSVVAYIEAGSGQVAGRYEYGPFGEVLRASGLNHPFLYVGWSTKYTDLETDLVYYGRRYYNPSTGRWLSRDPIGEEGGLNLYGFVSNNPIDRIDPNGHLELGGAWSMLRHLFFGDQAESVTLSEDLIAATRGNLGDLKDRLRSQLRGVLECCKSGKTQQTVTDNTFAIPEDHWFSFVSMGSWQVKLLADCDWKCGSPIAADKCSCSCNVQCALHIFISKTYTFQSGYNVYNDSWPIYLGFYLPSYASQLVFRWNDGQPGYFMSSDFKDSYSAELTPRCSK